MAKKENMQKKVSSKIIVRKNDDKNKNLKYFAFIFILGFILYGNTLNNGYALDDKAMIWSNQYTQKGFSGIKDILKGDSFEGIFGKDSKLEGGRYRPLSLITFAIEIEFFGKKMTDNIARNSYIGCPKVSHFFNILLYCCSLLILYVVLKKIFKNYKSKYEWLSIPFIATLLFAFHPLHTEVVANIKGRDEILAFLFVFLAFNSIINFTEKPKKKYELILVSIYMFLGLMSKETIITFLALIPITFYFFKEKKEFIKSLWGLIPLSIATIAYLIIRQTVIGNTLGIEITNLMNNPFYGMTISERYATIIYTLLLYLKLLIFPHPLTWDYYPYHIGILNFSNIWVILSIIIHIALLVIAIMGLKRKLLVSYCIFLYAITLSITSNILFSVGVFMNERFIYISLLGLCIYVAYLLSQKIPTLIKKEKHYKITAISTITIILLLFSIKVITRNKVWENSFTLFEHDINISQNSAKGNCTYACELYKLGEDAMKEKDTVTQNKYFSKAKKYFEKALEIYPQYEEARVHYGNIYYIMYGDYETMFDNYLIALKTSPLNKDVWNNSVGILTHNLNLPEYGKKIWLRYSEISDYYMSYLQLGVLYLNEQKNDSAIFFLEKAKEKNKSDFNTFNKLGTAYGNIGNYKEARNNLLQAIKIKEDAQTFSMIGITYGMENDNQKALKYFEKALNLAPKNQEYINNVMIARKNLGL